MFIYTLLTSLLFFSTPSISYEDDDPYYSVVEYCDIYQYCDNPDLDPEYLSMFSGDISDYLDEYLSMFSGDISDYLDEDFDGGDVEWDYLVDGDMTDEPDMLMNENWLMDWLIIEGAW